MKTPPSSPVFLVLSFLGVTTVNCADVSPCGDSVHIFHTCVSSPIAGTLYAFAALPGFQMLVPCSLSITEFDVCLPPLSKCYGI